MSDPAAKYFRSFQIDKKTKEGIFIECIANWIYYHFSWDFSDCSDEEELHKVLQKIFTITNPLGVHQLMLKKGGFRSRFHKEMADRFQELCPHENNVTVFRWATNFTKFNAALERLGENKKQDDLIKLVLRQKFMDARITE